MTINELNKLIINDSFLEYGDCSYNKGECSKKLKIYYFISLSTVDRLCNKHLKEQHRNEVIELSTKDVFYLKINAKL